MKKYTTALALLMLFGIGGLQAQALTTKVCKGETVCHTIGGHRGFVQWEQSADGNSWFLVPFMSADTFCMTADSNGYYRAAVQEGTCAPVYTEVRYVQAITVTADAGADGSVCANSGSLIGGSPTASGGVNPYSYSWTPGTGLNSTTDANPTAYCSLAPVLPDPPAPQRQDTGAFCAEHLGPHLWHRQPGSQPTQTQFLGGRTQAPGDQ